VLVDVLELLSGDDEFETFLRRLENVFVFFVSSFGFFAGDGVGLSEIMLIWRFGDCAGFSGFISYTFRQKKMSLRIRTKL